jgi:hypothetical protein
MYLVDDSKAIVNYRTNVMYPDYEAYDYTKTYNNGDVVVCLMDGYKYTSKSDSNNNFVTNTDYWDKGELLTQKHNCAFWCRDTIKYKTDDIVQYNGKTYKSLIDNNTYYPTDTYAWTKISDSVLNYEVWDSSKTYSNGDLVVYKKRNNLYYIYKSLGDSNNNEPSKSLAWFEVGPENAYKSMDIYLNTTITQDSSKNLVMFFEAQAFDSVSLLLVNGTHIKLELIDTNGNVLLTDEKDLIAGVTDWGDYFAADLEYYANGFFTFGLQYHRYVRLEVTTAKHNTIEVGKVVIGHKRYLGELTIGVSGHIDDYSKKNIDKNTGLAYLEQGHYNKEVNGKISLKTDTVDKVFGILTAKRAKPTLYLSGAEDKFNRLNVYGFYKDFNIRVDNCVLSTLTLRIQGLI